MNDTRKPFFLVSSGSEQKYKSYETKAENRLLTYRVWRPACTSGLYRLTVYDLRVVVHTYRTTIVQVYTAGDALQASRKFGACRKWRRFWSVISDANRKSFRFVWQLLFSRETRREMARESRFFWFRVDPSNSAKVVAQNVELREYVSRLPKMFFAWGLYAHPRTLHIRVGYA